MPFKFDVTSPNIASIDVIKAIVANLQLVIDDPNTRFEDGSTFSINQRAEEPTRFSLNLAWLYDEPTPSCCPSDTCNACEPEPPYTCCPAGEGCNAPENAGDPDEEEPCCAMDYGFKESDEAIINTLRQAEAVLLSVEGKSFDLEECEAEFANAALLESIAQAKAELTGEAIQRTPAGWCNTFGLRITDTHGDVQFYNTLVAEKTFLECLLPRYTVAVKGGRVNLEDR